MSPRIPLEIIHLGTFLLGSDPDSLTHQFLDDDGETPVDMSDGVWTTEAMAEQLHVSSQPAGIGAGVTTLNAVTATITYPWVAADFETAGRFRLTLWAGNSPDGKRHGQEFEYSVVDAAGDAPTV